MLFVKIYASVSDQLSLDSLVVVVNSRIFTVCFQGTNKAFLQHGFAYITFDYIFSRSEASIDTVVDVSFQCFIQALLYLMERKCVVLRPSIKFLYKALCLK